MFRRARLSVKPNVRPGGGARGSAAAKPQRGQEAARPPEPAAEPAPEPADPTDVPAADFGGPEPQEKAPTSSNEEIGGENNVEESCKSPSTASRRRRRLSSTSSLVNPTVSVPSQSPPLSAVNQDVPQPDPIPTKDKQPCSDRYRIYKAQKLREMLKEELRKEKKQWKNKYAINESQMPPDRSKMTMRDFIYYLPDNNPMSSSLEQEKKMEKSLSPVQTRDRQESKSALDAEDNEAAEEETDDGPLLVPRVKVAEDGSIILDEESLTVEVLRTKGPCVVEENDPIFECGSTTTYSSFRKNYYSKPWSNKETDMFFLAISMVGTDFSMIGQLFPHRARIEIKNKFKREEKTNGWRIDKAFQEKRPFDFDFFAHLLQKVLAEEEKRKQKSAKNQGVKKKSSKPRKTVKGKKVTSEVVDNDPDECVSTKVSDTERSQRDDPAVAEEESLTSSGQNAEVTVEQDQNQKRRRKKKNQEGANEQELQSLSGNATVQSDSSEREKHKNKCQSLRPEVNGSECSKEQTLSCTQNLDDVELASCGRVEERNDPLFSASHQHGNTPAATESSALNPSALSPSEVGITALCEVNPAKQSCTEERNVDQKSKSLEADQAETVKPVARGRLQRPKPNLSRAAGKKPVVSQGGTDAESESSHSETSVEKTRIERDKINTSDNCQMENTDKKNSEAETMSNLSEKTCVLEDTQPKVPRPARLVRGRLQRPKPNVGKAAERKEMITSQEQGGASVELSQNESCVSKDIPQQMEDQSCKNSECEDLIKQPEKKDLSFQNVRPNEPRAPNECLSIEEGNEANLLRQVPVLRTRFQKPKPNIVRGIGRREIPSKEEVQEESLVSGEVTATLRELVRPDTSPGEEVPVVTAAASEEVKSDCKESGIRDISPGENKPEITDVTAEVETKLEATAVKCLPRETMPELIDATGELETDLEENRREILPQENDPEEVKPIGEIETGLQETGREMPTRERTPEMIDITEERETDLEETERREIPVPLKVPAEIKTIGEMETDLKDTEGEISQWGKVQVEVSTLGEKEIDLKETGKRDISLVETILRKMTVTEETEADLKETGGEVSLRDRGAREIGVVEETVADLEKTGNADISPRENKLEESSTSGQTETDVMQSSSDCSISLAVKDVGSDVQPLVHTHTEEKELPDHLSCLKIASQTSELGKTEDGGIQLPDVSEHFSDTNLSSKSPQEQKPLEGKPAPFVRSRFKRPKPNLARAVSKKESSETEKCVTEKLETNRMETIVIQQDSEQANTLSSQPNVASLMTSREKDKSGHEKEEAVILPCIQIEKDPAPLSACELTEDSQSVQTQENDLVVPMGTQKLNTSQQEMKESVTQVVLPTRARLQRPKPNVRNARHRQVVEKVEAKGMSKDERTVLQKDETTEKSVTVSNSQIETEIEVVSSKVSECRVDENKSHEAPVENLHVNKTNVSGEKMRHGSKLCVPRPAQLMRRKFQKAKPDLGRAHSKKMEEPGVEKGLADQNGASKPEDHSLQQGNPDTQLHLKEDAEILTSPGPSARKDYIGSEESVLVKKNAQSEDVGPSGCVREETMQDNSLSSVVEKQCFSRLPSGTQLLKEPNYSKAAPDGRTALFSASGSEIEQSERRSHRKIKTTVTRGRGTKRARARTSRKEPRAPKAMLVTLRASQEEDDDDAQDFESDYEEESCHLAPEEVNKAPVFVPLGLRSPEPVSAQIEETMEELEITVNVADVGCVTVVEHQLSNTDVTVQKLEQENNLNMPFEMITGEQTQNEPGPSDGSTEAAITLLTMGDLVLQSEISVEQGDVGVCVFPDVHSKDKSHIPFSPDNVSHKIVHECQELSSPVTNTSPAPEENKSVSEEQNTRGVGLNEEVMENSTSTRSTTSKANSDFRPKPDLEVLVTNRADAHQEVSSAFKGEEGESQKETANSASKATALEDQNPGLVTAAVREGQSQLACVEGDRGTSVAREAALPKRNEDQAERSQEVQMLAVASLSSEAALHTLGSSGGPGENSVEEPPIEDAKGDGEPTLHVPEQCTPASIPEVQQENVTNTQDLTVNLFANVHPDGEDEQAFILTLVEIPTSASATQLTSDPVLPAPILVKSVNPEEKGDISMTLPVTSVCQDAVCLLNSQRDDSEKPSANLDLTSRKRLHCRLDESSQVPPAKRCSLTLRNDRQQCTSEVCSKELNVFEETGESYKGQGISTTSGSTHTTPEPQEEQLEPAFQNTESRSLDKVIDTCIEKNMPRLSQDDVAMSDKEERIGAALKAEQRGGRTSSSKAPLSRPGRRPLGFLALICSKNNLESDEPTHVHSKKRLKPLIPVSRRNLKKSNPPDETQKKTQESSGVLPSPSDVTSTQAEDSGGSAAQVSCDQPSLKEECKSGQKRAPESEEPTTVSEYFFGDIFIEVDEAE